MAAVKGHMRGSTSGDRETETRRQGIGDVKWSGVDLAVSGQQGRPGQGVEIAHVVAVQQKIDETPRVPLPQAVHACDSPPRFPVVRIDGPDGP